MVPHVHSSLLMSFQRISPGPRLAIPFRNMLRFYDEELFSPRPTPKPHFLLSANAHSIYSQLHSISGDRHLHPQPEVRHVVVTGKNSNSTSQKTQCVSSTKNSHLMVYKEIEAVHSTKHAKCTNALIVWTKCIVRDFKAGALHGNFKCVVTLLHFYAKLLTDTPY